MKKIIYLMISIICVLSVLAYLYLRHISTKGLPQYDGEIIIENLIEPVTIYRDQNGIPHIYARNEHDLYLATGYVMAQDRLWQMDLMRRATLGRLSEIFGEEFIQTDLLLRSLSIPQKSIKVIADSDEKVMNSLRSFSDGVNQFIDTHIEKLPPEFTILGYEPEKWKPEYSVNMIGYMAWDLTFPWNIEVTFHKIRGIVGEKMADELLAVLLGEKTFAYPNFSQLETNKSEIGDVLLSAMEPLQKLGIAVFEGSNNWVISGAKSVTGKPIFANDMHLGLSAPGVWYQLHQTIPGRLNVTGVALPGQPMVVAGHNENIAWGMTNLMVDDMDFYLEKINPDNPDEYLFNDQWVKMDIRKEIIKTKEGETVEKKIKFTHRGPIISEFKKIDDQPISMRWVGNEMSNEVRSLYLMNRARNWADFKDAASTFISVSQNIAYADVEGNIGLYCSAGVPIRKKGNGSRIMPGWTDEYDWAGLVPFEDLPHEYNPPQGFVSSANNRSVGDKAEQIYQYPALHYRIDRINEMLTAKDKLSIEDMKLMQGDHKSKLVEELLNKFLQSLNDFSEYSNLEREILNFLNNWDGISTIDGIETTVFEQLYIQLIRNLLVDELGDKLYDEYLKVGYLPRYAVDYIMNNPTSQWVDNVNTPNVSETLSQIIIQSFQEAIDILKTNLGSDPNRWEWGKIHTLTLEHPLGKVSLLNTLFKLNRGPYPAGGSAHTAAPYRYSYRDPFKINFGASHRHIYSTANWDESQTVLPTGISGIPASEYYCDQTEMYINQEYHPDYISLDRVKKNAKHILTLISKK